MSGDVECLCVCLCLYLYLYVTTLAYGGHSLSLHPQDTVNVPSSVPLAVGKNTFLFHRQTKLEPDSKFGSLEGSSMKHPIVIIFHGYFCWALTFMCLVSGDIYRNSLWHFTSYSIASILCIQLSDSFLELIEILECLEGSVFQILFLKCYFYQVLMGVLHGK